jgi:hypothetical protein
MLICIKALLAPRLDDTSHFLLVDRGEIAYSRPMQHVAIRVES